MQYKTITLQLIQDRPQLYDQLISKRTLLQTLNRYAEELRDIHHTWMGRLWQANPNSAASQIASEALEMAVKDLVDQLAPVSPPDDGDQLDEAMAFIRSHTSNG